MRSVGKEEVVITNVASTLLKLYEPTKLPSAPHPFAAGPVRRNTSRLLDTFLTSCLQH